MNKFIKDWGWGIVAIYLAYIVTIYLLHPAVEELFKQEEIKNIPQTVRPLSEEEVFLSCIINAEASHSDTVDAYLIGSTVLNRVEDPRFPDCVKDVVFQDGQYDGVRGKFQRTDFSDTIARRLFNNIGRNCDVLFFFNPETATDKYFVNRLQRNGLLAASSERHKFYSKK